MKQRTGKAWPTMHRVARLRVELEIDGQRWRELGWGEPNAEQAADWLLEVIENSKGHSEGAVTTKAIRVMAR